MGFKFPQTVNVANLVINKMQVIPVFNENGIASLQVHLFDQKGRKVNHMLQATTPTPTKAQLAAMNATPALAGETITAWINRATQSYIASAYNLTPSTPTGSTGHSGGITGVTGVTGPAGATGPIGMVGPGVPH